MARIETGQRYKKAGSTWMIWEIIGLAQEEGGVPHYRIVDVGDQSNTKTISVMALTNPNLFQRV